MSHREDIGKVLLVLGIFFLITAINMDFVYFAMLIISVVFFYFLYKSRRNFRDDLTLVGLLISYLFFLVFSVFFLGALSGVPPIYLGSFGVLLAFLGAYQSGYLERIKGK